MLHPTRRADQRGLSLVEMMVSLLVFALMTVGVVPLMASALRGSNLARSYTIGKNITQEAMERIRSLPYYISFGTQPRRVDVLDLYLPCSTSATCGPIGTTYDATAMVFTTTCNSTTTANPACPKDIPSEYEIRFTAKFVSPGLADVEGRETYAVAAPATGYRWDLSPSDIPVSRMMGLTVSANWPLYGTTKNYTLNTLVTDRKVADERVRGNGKVAYAIQVLAGYRTLLGAESRLTALTGSAESRIETRLLSQSDQSAESGSLRLVKDASGNVPASDLVVENGASTFLHAPPDNTSGGGVDAALHTVTHPELSPPVAIAELGQSSTANLSTTTASQLPSAFGTSNVTGRFWVNNQADLGQEALLRLDVGAGRELLRSVTNLSSTTTGTTTATTSGDRKVETSATTTVPDFRLFPVTFIPGEQTIRTLIQIKDFTATVNCKSTASATASTTASYDADFSLWRENDQSVQGDNQTKGSLITFDLGSAAGRSALNAYGPTGTNPIVYEHFDLLNLAIGHEQDIYLFASPGQNKLVHEHGAIAHNHPAFFTSWKVLESVTPAAPSDGGRMTAAVLADIIQMNSTPLKPEWPQTAINVSLGNLSCEAVDRR